MWGDVPHWICGPRPCQGQGWTHLVPTLDSLTPPPSLLRPLALLTCYVKVLCMAASSRASLAVRPVSRSWPVIQMGPGGSGGAVHGTGTLPLSPLSGKPNFSGPRGRVLAHGRVICRRGSSSLPAFSPLLVRVTTRGDWAADALRPMPHHPPSPLRWAVASWLTSLLRWHWDRE